MEIKIGEAPPSSSGGVGAQKGPLRLAAESNPRQWVSATFTSEREAHNKSQAFYAVRARSQFEVRRRGATVYVRFLGPVADGLVSP